MGLLKGWSIAQALQVRVRVLDCVLASSVCVCVCERVCVASVCVSECLCGFCVLRVLACE